MLKTFAKCQYTLYNCIIVNEGSDYMLTLKERQKKDGRVQVTSFSIYRSQFEELKQWKDLHGLTWTETFQEILENMPKE